MPFIAVRDLRLYYEIRGTGPRLLYISGTGVTCDARRMPLTPRSLGNSRSSPMTNAG
jgi:hypothetical protein